MKMKLARPLNPLLILAKKITCLTKGCYLREVYLLLLPCGQIAEISCTGNHTYVLILNSRLLYLSVSTIMSFITERFI